MKKQIICVVAVILTVLIQNETAAQKIKLLTKTHLTDYPSASSLEFYKDKLYVIGDDASYILVLNKDHEFVDTFRLFESNGKRIKPEIKADLESSAVVANNGKNYLVIFSSFSTANPNKIIFLELGENKTSPKMVNARLEKVNVEELNIEGATTLEDKIILSNRANTTHKINRLVIATLDESGTLRDDVKTIPIRLPKTKQITGISGLFYVKEKDVLLFSASTEDTPNAYTDGKIGISYIGYVRNFSKKLSNSTVKTKMMPVSKYLKEKNAQKIESITVEEVNKKSAIVHLAADNDNGESTLFKLRVKL